jgi:hypothetical protein
VEELSGQLAALAARQKQLEALVQEVGGWIRV